MGTDDWMAIADACPIALEQLPVGGTREEQAEFLRRYLAHAQQSENYECYESVERVLAQLEDAATSPFMDA